MISMFERSMLKKSLISVCFVFTSFVLMSARTVSECKTQLKDIAQSLVDNNVQNSKINSFILASSNLSEEDLIDMCDQIFIYRKELGSKTSEVAAIKEELISYLRSFVASGMDVGEVDPNFAFIYNVQNPNFTVTFKNTAGEIRTRKYALNVKSIGLKFELVIKIDAIKILGSGFNYYDSMNKEYELGTGVDVGYYPNLLESEATTRAKAYEREAEARNYLEFFDVLQQHPVYYNRVLEAARAPRKEKWHIGACLTFAKIKGTTCILMIGGVAFGLGGSLTGTGIEGSFVIGGKMTPIAE
jgi:hypothetical protein